MTASVNILIMAFYFVKANSLENIYSDNGWRPMSNEKVFALQRNFIKSPVQIKNVGNSLADVLEGNAIKIVKPYAIHLNVESIKGQEAISLPSIGSGRVFDDKIEVGFEQLTKNMNIKTNTPRKAKKIAESDIMLIRDNEINNSNNNFARTKPTETNYNKENNTYEVHETVIPIEVTPENDDLKPLDSNGYRYETPKIRTQQNNNLTAKLINILANYNIRSGDKLPNYASSLRQNSRNSDKENFIYMHVPIKIPLRYNSPNHYPIDPLLAVFLSNYGHYLPGLYGFQRSYNNLYGHLASNNIHNNNPFGSYKVFSDTDSFS